MATTIHNTADIQYKSHFAYPVTDKDGNLTESVTVQTGEVFDELVEIENRINELMTMDDGINALKKRRAVCQAKLRYATDLVCGGPAPLGSRNEMTLRGRGTVLASSYRVSEYKVESKIRQQTKIKRAITESFSDSGHCSRPLTELDANKEAVIQGRTDEELQAVFSQAR